jgi:hypothetical protein
MLCGVCEWQGQACSLALDVAPAGPLRSGGESEKNKEVVVEGRCSILAVLILMERQKKKQRQRQRQRKRNR